jgi:hypothetical protein
MNAKSNEGARKLIGRGTQTALAVDLLCLLPIVQRARAQDSETQWAKDDNAGILYVHYVTPTQKGPLTLDISTQHHYVAGIRSTDW